MENKTRIAFCISGQARTFDTTYPFFKVNLFDAAKEQGFEYDIFCAVEDDEDIKKIYVMNPTVIEKIKSSSVQTIIDEKYGNFINNNFKNQFKFRDYSYQKVSSFLQQAYKIEKVNQLKNNYSDEHNITYDIVVRLRFDIFFVRTINFNAILNDIKNGGVILNEVTPPWLVHISDHFSFGDHNSMNIYSNLFSNFTLLFTNKYSNLINKLGIFFYNFIYFFIKILKKIKFIKKVVNFFTIKIDVIFDKNFINIYTNERLFYENLIIHKINIIKTHISYVLMRKNERESFLECYEKSNYEI